MCRDGQQYAEPYFSTKASKSLSFGEHWLRPSMDMRHMFATAWKDFVQSPQAAFYELTAGQMLAAAADLMLSSTNQLDNTYDDSNRGRGTMACLSQYSKFREFVRQAYMVKQTEE